MINLDRRSDRLTRMQSQFDQLGLSFDRLSAFDAQNNAFIKDNCPSYLSHPEFGCYLSHRSAWQRLVDSQDTHCAVFEDDLLVDESLSVVLATEAFFNQGADITSIEASLYPSTLDRVNRFQKDGIALREAYNFVGGAGGYVITRTLAQILLDQSEYPNVPVDDLLFDMNPYLAPRPRIFKLDPAPVIQIWHVKNMKGNSETYSDIHTERLGRKSTGRKVRKSPMNKICHELIRPFKKIWNSVYHEYKPIPFAGFKNTGN